MSSIPNDPDIIARAACGLAYASEFIVPSGGNVRDAYYLAHSTIRLRRWEGSEGCRRMTEEAYDREMR